MTIKTLLAIATTADYYHEADREEARTLAKFIGTARVSDERDWAIKRLTVVACENTCAICAD